MQPGVQPVPAVARGGGGFGSAAPRSGPPVPRLLQDAQDMALRDRNHPSVVIWSLCNELGCDADDPAGGSLANAFKLQLYVADSTRPVTSNTVQSNYLSGRIVDPFAASMDVQSFSYEYSSYDRFHQAAPWRPVGGGESASCVADRGEYGPSNGTTGHVGSSLASFTCAADAWAEAATREFVFGCVLAGEHCSNCRGQRGAHTRALYRSRRTLTRLVTPAAETSRGPARRVIESEGPGYASFPHPPALAPASLLLLQDYLGETYPLGWPDVSSHFGIFGAQRGGGPLLSRPPCLSLPPTPHPRPCRLPQGLCGLLPRLVAQGGRSQLLRGVPLSDGLDGPRHSSRRPRRRLCLHVRRLRVALAQRRRCGRDAGGAAPGLRAVGCRPL